MELGPRTCRPMRRLTAAYARGLRSGRGSVTSRIHRSFMRSVPLNEERRLSDHELE